MKPTVQEWVRLVAGFAIAAHALTVVLTITEGIAVEMVWALAGTSLVLWLLLLGTLFIDWRRDHDRGA